MTTYKVEHGPESAERTRELPMRVGMATFAPPTEDRLRFMKQIGVDDVVLWGTTFGISNRSGEGDFSQTVELSCEELARTKGRIEDAGLRLFAIETLPLHFYDKIILGQKGRDQQIEHFKNTIRNMGRVGILILGYNWMPNGVWRTSSFEGLRGGAKGIAFDLAKIEGVPLAYDREYTEDEFWEHYQYFLEKVLPVVENEGVKLALHPNDPPVEKIGGVPFLFRNFENLKRAMDLVPSDNHGLTCCLGSMSEMGGNLVEKVRYFGKRNKLLYVHFQAVNGAVPFFHETFVDQADYDAYEILKTLLEVEFRGVMIPGHVPQIEGDTEWRTPESAAFTPYGHSMGGHRARAYTIGYLKGMLDSLRHQEQHLLHLSPPHHLQKRKVCP